MKANVPLLCCFGGFFLLTTKRNDSGWLSDAVNADGPIAIIGLTTSFRSRPTVAVLGAAVNGHLQRRCAPGSEGRDRRISSVLKQTTRRCNSTGRGILSRRYLVLMNSGRVHDQRLDTAQHGPGQPHRTVGTNDLVEFGYINITRWSLD